jgi:hypothetical protein
MKQKEFKGSQRCMLELISSPDFLFKINSLIQNTGAIISKNDNWFPLGLTDLREAELKDFLRQNWNANLGNEITNWWLAVMNSNSRTPNWDFVSTCHINGQKGILLIEAKAHQNELESSGKKLNKDASENSVRNHIKIGKAINEAKVEINQNFGGVSISRDKCYQLSNRVAHAWWLAKHDIPVVLLYLGFLNAEDMNYGGRVIFTSDEDWKTCFLNHSRQVGVDWIVNQLVNCGKSSFKLIVKSSQCRKKTNLLNNAEIQQMVQQHNKTKLHKKQVSYNLFTISSYNSYLENFHSDIVSSLLNPIGLHQQGNTFLHLFIDYLNKEYNCNLLTSDFQDTIVTRETGRLDIWIRDEKSKQSIIIENKINNAADMDEQIDRYFNYAENARKYKVKAVVYLSLDGTKKAPPTIENLEHLVKNIGAFTNMENDLVNGWLQLCLKSHGNTDSLSVIHQYIKLIQHLANKNMDTKTMDSFYQFLSTHDGIEIANTIVEMNSKLSTYRADKFANAITNIAPFKKPFRYRQNYWLYENYRVGNSNLKLDVWFEYDGSALVEFWNPSIRGIEGRKPLTEKLTAIGLIEEFSEKPSYADNGYRKIFKIGDTYKTMVEVDNAIIAFVNNLMKQLRES